MPLAAVVSRARLCALLPESNPVLTWSSSSQPCSPAWHHTVPFRRTPAPAAGADPGREQQHSCSLAGTPASLSTEFCSPMFQDTSSNLMAFPLPICRRHMKHLVPWCSLVHAPRLHQRCTACAAPMQQALLLAARNHRITESQNGLGWNRP